MDKKLPGRDDEKMGLLKKIRVQENLVEFIPTTFK